MPPDETPIARAQRLRRESQAQRAWSVQLILEAQALCHPPVDVRWPAPARRTPGQQMIEDTIHAVLGRYAWPDPAIPVPPPRRTQRPRRTDDAA
jgi:hypothetical protein